MPDRKSSPSPQPQPSPLRPVSPPAASPPTSSTTCCAGSARSTRSWSRAISPRSPIATAAGAHRRDRAAPPRHAAPSLARNPRTRAFRRCAARRDVLLIGAAQILFLDVPDHAAVDLAVRLVQADRHAAHYPGLINAVLRRLARDGKAPLAATRHDAARHAGLAVAALVATYGDERARDRAAHPQRAAARSHGEDPMPRAGRRRSRPRAADRQGAHHPLGPDPAAARLHRGRLVGAGRRRRAAGAAARRRRRQVASPISAPRPAARPRSWRWPAPRSPPSTARRRGSRGCAKISRASAQRRDRPGRRHRMAGRARSTPCWSMRPARRPARSAAIPTSPGSRPRPISRSSPPCRRRLLDRAVTLVKPGGTHRLLHLLARTRGGRAADRGASWPQAGAAPRSGPARRDRRHRRVRSRRTARLRTLPAIWPTRSRGWRGLDGFFAARTCEQRA